MRKRLLTLICVLLPFQAVIIRMDAQNAQFSYHISNHEVQAFAQDERGYLWIGTAWGLNRYNGTNYSIYYAGSSPEQLNSNNVQALCLDSDGRLWTGTECGIGYYEGGRFYHYANAIYNPVSQILELDKDKILVMGKDGLISFSKDNIETTVDRFYDNGTSWVTNAAVSGTGDVWLPRISGDSTYVDVLDGSLKRVEQYYLGQDLPVIGVVEKPSGSVWVATGRGIRRYDSRSRTPLPTPQPLAELVKGQDILFMLPYRDNNLLIGLADNGIYSYNDIAGTVMHLIPEQHLTGRKYVCFVDRDNNIWLSDGESDIRFYAENRTYTHLSPAEQDPSLDGGITHLCFDREGYMWMLANHRICSMDTQTGDILWISPDRIEPWVIHIDGAGRLWCISQEDEVYQFRVSGGRAYEEQVFTLSGRAFTIDEDSAGQIWLAMSRQLAVIGPDGAVEYKTLPGVPFTMTFTDPVSRRLFLFTVNRGLYEILPDRTFRQLEEQGLANSSCMTTGRGGILWCGTYNEGLIRYDESSGSLERFNNAEGMVSGNIKSILEDDEGSIWFSTSEHITRYDPRRGTFSTLHDDRFSNGRFYNLVSGAKGPDGRLYFGGYGGITVVDPSSPLQEKRDTPLSFEYIAVGGQQHDEDSPSLNLSWKENSLILRFSGLNFESGSQLSYAYMLDGYDRDWQFRSSNVQANYSQVPPGRYVFRARVREQDGAWSTDELSLPVNIKPAPWFSWWAKTLYALLALLLLWLALRAFIHIRIQRDELAIAKQREEMKQQHIDFVTNISHEFRTPLSMIYAPVKELEKHQLTDRDKELVGTISRNAERLRGLAEQILSTKGGRQEHEALRIRQNDLSSIVRRMAVNFSYAASQKDQTLSTDMPDSMICWFDTEKVSKILGNLVSNAIKYTPEGGHIHLALEEPEPGLARISVSDDGIGIPEEKRDRIFQRYDRLGAETSGVIGSGIGLNYARSLALLHKGSLEFSPNSPAGSVFTLQIPVGHDAFPDTDIDETAYRPYVGAAEEDGGEKRGTLLIAEDTDEIRFFLRDIFSPYYQVVLAPDGLEAEETLKLAVPDLVLSDVIMPGKTGFALCSDIKENPDWCHIPVILLTAKADAQSNIEGMRHGADAYIPKPFDPDVLFAAVESQIRNRRLIQDRVLNLTSTTLKEPEKAKEAQLSAADRSLLERIHAWMDAHLDDETVGVQEMARETGMSYSSLYAKLKGLTGQTPQAFMMHYRMNIALELLQSGDLNVSEVAYRVGSSSPSTFSREFKKHFGYPPSQVLQS